MIWLWIYFATIAKLDIISVERYLGYQLFITVCTIYKSTPAPIHVVDGVMIIMSCYLKAILWIAVFYVRTMMYMKVIYPIREYTVIRREIHAFSILLLLVGFNLAEYGHWTGYNRVKNLVWFVVYFPQYFLSL
jgi:hypothetical protein